MKNIGNCRYSCTRYVRAQLAVVELQVKQMPSYKWSSFQSNMPKIKIIL
jgi:hypothetical protein